MRLSSVLLFLLLGFAPAWAQSPPDTNAPTAATPASPADTAITPDAQSPEAVPGGVNVHWYGHGFVYLVSSVGIRAAIDPFGPDTVHYTFPPHVTADFVMVTHEAEDHCAADRIFGLLPPDQASGFRAVWDEFEARETPESRFAAAVDRFQPMLLNLETEGAAWARHGVTEDRVRARNAHIAEGSKVLWDYMSEQIGRAVAAGHLAPKPSG